LSSEKDSIVKSLAVDLGLSGTYAEELCSAAALDKAKAPSSLSQSELAALFSSLQRLLSMKPSPVAILDGSGRVAEVFPFPTAETAAVKTKSFSSFNEAVEALAVGQLESSFSSSRESPSLRRIRELEIAIGQQQSTIAGMEKAANEATAAAEAIYVHYQGVKGILDDYNALRKTFSPEQLREYFKPNKFVKNIDEKTGTIALEIEDKSNGAQ
jgi:predicted ribosome quality control (RQC) complex YloA/Tae2 family protein